MSRKVIIKYAYVVNSQNNKTDTTYSRGNSRTNKRLPSVIISIQDSVGDILRIISCASVGIRYLWQQLLVLLRGYSLASSQQECGKC